MRTTIATLFGALLIAGAAHAQAVNTGTTAGNTKEYSGCAVPPCVGGVPTAAPGGEAGSGPAAIRTAPMDSPVGTGVGGGSGSSGNGNGGNNGSDSGGKGSAAK